MVNRLVGDTSDAIKAIARPIHGEASIDSIVEMIATKRIVLIGEASHGTHEFYDLRASITRQLIAEHEFAAVVVEGDWPDALRVDRFVRDGHSVEDEDTTAEQALGAFERFPRWMWRNEDAAQFVEWLRAFNERQPSDRRAGFYGLDLYSLHASMEAVVQYLDDNDPAAAARARARYACFDHVGDDAAKYAMQAHLGIGPKCETEVVAQLVELQMRKLARSGRSPSGDAWFHAVQAHVVRNAEAYYHTMFAGRTAAWNVRDTHMADTLDMLANHLGKQGVPAKLVVWAHNSHVGDARATAIGDDGQLTLGQLMRERHPGETALVGFTTHEGTVTASHDWDEPAEKRHVRPSLPGSWEHLFHQVGLPRFFLTAGDLAQVVGDIERLQRAIGVVYRPETERLSHYLQTRLAHEVDLVIHIDSTRGVEPLDRHDFDEDEAVMLQEIPATFPTGA